MSEIRAMFEPGSWRDFSKEHEALRTTVEQAIARYSRGGYVDPLAVWGAYGAGKTQFLFWVAETAVEQGFIPLYFHLNDLLDGMPELSSPDDFKRHAAAFVAEVIRHLREDEISPKLQEVFRDKALLKYVRERLKPNATKAVLLVDEVEQAYLSLARQIRADDRSPLRAWLEEETFKIFAFAVGSLYVLGRADRERLTVQAIPPVYPRAARNLCADLPPHVVNGLWWLSRGKPRHFMKAYRKYQLTAPATSGEVFSFVSSLDSVSQAPYEGDSQSAVPAAYVDQLDANEVGLLLRLGPSPGGTGKLVPVSAAMQEVLLPILKDTFKLERVAFDLVRYVALIAESVAVDGYFALTEQDTPFLLRAAVDFLLEYERERLEKETVEGNAALRKLLEVHDSACHRAGEVYWKLVGKMGDCQSGCPVLPFAALASAFPLPTTSPTLFGTDPAATRAKYEEQKQPVFEWRDQSGNQILFLTSVASMYGYSSSTQFRQVALAPTGGVLVLLPYDAEDWKLQGLLEWLDHHDRLRVARLPLALTDFLLSLRAASPDGIDPVVVAEQVEENRDLKRQVSFYRGRLESFTSEMSGKPFPLVPSPLPGTLRDLENRVADKANLTASICQAFEAMSPTVMGSLADLRAMVLATRTIWDRKVAPGFVALAEAALPHKSSRAGRPENAKLIDDVRIAFSTHRDSLTALASYVDADDMGALSNERAGDIALRALWQMKRGISDGDVVELNPASRQLAEVSRVLDTLAKIETQLKTFGVSPDLGELAVLLEARNAIEATAKHAEELIKGRVTADKQLARALYTRFIVGFLANVEADVARAKAKASKLQDAIDALASSRERIALGTSAELLGFADIPVGEIEKLIDIIMDEHVGAVATASSLESIVDRFEVAGQAMGELEAHLLELSEARSEICALLFEKEDSDEN